MARVAENGPAGSAADRPTLARRIGAWGRETRGYPRNVWLLLLFTLGKGIQLSIGQVTLTLYLASIGFKSDFIGLLIGVPAIGALIAALPVGYLADRIPRKPLLLITGLLNPVSLALFGVLTDPTALMVAAFANGVLSSAYWVTIIPMLTEAVPPRQRVSVMSLNTFLLLGVGSLGGLLGGEVPALVGALTGLPAASPEPLRWGVIAAAIAVFLPTAPLFWLREGQVAAETEPASADATPAANAGLADVALAPAPALVEYGPQPSARPIWLLFILLLVPDVLYTAGEGAVVALEPLFFHLRFNLSVPLIGAIVAGGGLLIGVTALLAPGIVRRYGKLRVITTAQLLSAPIALLIGYAPWAWLSGSAELGRNLLRGAFEPVYATFAMERVSARYRARWKTKQLERDFDRLKASFDALRADHDALLQDN
ncbi:MAG: MFS transporter, partial [Chloroflexota bacterium]|nr:MFS transporter [Chloroflexota bacterium]